jgi:protein phosphatase
MHSLYTTCTDTGKLRQQNEDCMGHAVNNSLNGEIFCVADGMGGHGHGELASQAAVDATLNGFMQITAWDVNQSHKLLTDLFTAAETAIHDEKRKNSITATMGTTLAVLIVLPEAILCANIGDSRIYCLRERDLTQKSHDHTMVNELLEKNQITIEEAKAHPQKNVLTRALTGETTLAAPFVQVEPAAAGTIYLLCSDGLYNMVDEDYMAEILRTSSIFQARDSFLTQAYANGATDNLTFQIIKPWDDEKTIS